MDAEFLRDLFSGFRPVSVRRMFGGAGIYCDGTMFALVSGGAIYLKAGERNNADFDAERLEPFSYKSRSGRRAVMSYRRMPDRLYDDPEELARWAERALAQAQGERRRPKPVARASRAATRRRLTADHRDG